MQEFFFVGFERQVFTPGPPGPSAPFGSAAPSDHFLPPAASFEKKNTKLQPVTSSPTAGMMLEFHEFYMDFGS